MMTVTCQNCPAAATCPGCYAPPCRAVQSSPIIIVSGIIIIIMSILIINMYMYIYIYILCAMLYDIGAAHVSALRARGS